AGESVKGRERKNGERRRRWQAPELPPPVSERNARKRGSEEGAVA
ncbi:hypothetical protein A2U01_0042886, partial [Trifolium medium]|nr:hypothetical protein [Trifolium medium]